MDKKIKLFLFTSVTCTPWYASVTSPSCVTDLLVSNTWANGSQLAKISSSDDRVSLLKAALNQALNGTFHSIVELSAR